MGDNSYLIIERNVAEARNTWPSDAESRPFLVISEPAGTGKDGVSGRTDAVCRWSHLPPPLDSGQGQIVVLFESVQDDAGALLMSMDLDRLSGFRTWLHYGGERDLATIKDSWTSHDICRALGDRAEVVQSELGFPPPVVDRLDFGWKVQWRDFKAGVRDLDDLGVAGLAPLHRALDAAWSAATNECRALLEQDGGEWAPVYFQCLQVTAKIPSDGAISREQASALARTLDEALVGAAADGASTSTWEHGALSTGLKAACAAILSDQSVSEEELQRRSVRLREAAASFVESRDSSGE